ncbi:MAG: hypothetical protein LBV54_06685 [Puniceicoccales bacterium]|jgi:hypothetical protein|nr:hypothetical protein [Puniceicoccales bacterium]
MKKTVNLSLLGTALLVASAAPAVGQTTLPGASPFGTPISSSRAAPAPQPAPASSVVQNTNATPAGDYRSSTSENMADRLFNVNSDSIDFDNASFKWKNSNFRLGDSRLMRARFERYLAMPVPDGDARRYNEVLRRIEDLLSPAKINKETYSKNLLEAWKLLYEAGNFEADAGNCLIIATLVDKTAKMHGEFKELQLTQRQYDEMYKTNRSHATAWEDWRDSQKKATRAGGKGGVTIAPAPSGAAKQRVFVEEAARNKKDALKTEAGMTAIGFQARLEYQSQIVAFLLERRFHHALIANSFYRQMFQGSANKLEVGRKQIKELFPLENFTPTTDAVDMLAREAIKDVENGVKSILQSYDEGHRFTAFQRLQENFFLGEFEMPIVFFDADKKRVLAELWRDLRDLQGMGDDRDLAGVERVVNKVKAVAQDFPSSSVMSKVNNAMQASNLAVLSAQTAAFKGDTEKAEVQIERATKLWPTNPSVRKFAEDVVGATNKLAQSIPEFDRLQRSGQKRDIYNRKEEFMVALVQDAERAVKLKDILNEVSKIDFCITSAQALHKQGNKYVAWDFLQEARGMGSNDPELNRAISEMAPSVADYARLLSDADKNEREGNYAPGLAAFLLAQDINQTSEFCRKGIERLSQRILDQILARPSGTSAAN